MAERVQEKVDLPLIDIRIATADAIHAKNLKKVGLLGTTYTMELNFYKDKLLEHNIQSIVSKNQVDRNFIEKTLLYELGKGILVNETKKNTSGLLTN